MFYRPELADHGLPHSPFKALIVPRPIAWITTLDAAGKVNLAPFSQFNIIGWDPARIMFSAGKTLGGRTKDTVANVEATREFVLNLATYELRHQVARTGAIDDSTIDEMAATGLTPVASRLVKPPRIKESPVHLECRFEQTICLPFDTPGDVQYVVFGRVVGIHIADDCITPDGLVDILKIRPLARMGYLDYTSVTEIFQVGEVDAGEWAGMSGGH